MHRCQSGAVALEFAIVSLFLVLISIGVIQFGRGLYVRNEMAYAADKGARAALIDADISDTALENTVRDAFSGPDADQLQVVVGTETVNGRTYRTAKLVYPLTLEFLGLTDADIELSITRRIPVI